jgi:hypothetical protein
MVLNQISAGLGSLDRPRMSTGPNKYSLSLTRSGD